MRANPSATASKPALPLRRVATSRVAHQQSGPPVSPRCRVSRRPKAASTKRGNRLPCQSLTIDPTIRDHWRICWNRTNSTNIFESGRFICAQIVGEGEPPSSLSIAALHDGGYSAAANAFTRRDMGPPPVFAATRVVQFGQECELLRAAEIPPNPGIARCLDPVRRLPLTNRQSPSETIAKHLETFRAPAADMVGWHVKKQPLRFVGINPRTIGHGYKEVRMRLRKSCEGLENSFKTVQVFQDLEHTDDVKPMFRREIAEMLCHACHS